MLKNKKFLVSVLMVVFTLALAACGGGNNSSKDGASNNDGGADKITILQSKVEITEGLEELANIYEEETGVEVEIWGATDGDFFQHLQMRLNSNQGPSIYSVSTEPELEKIKSYVHDLSDEAFIKDIAPGMELESDGKIYGVPYGVEGIGIVYNKEMVSPEDIADLESFTETMKKFNEEGINGMGIVGDGVWFLIGHMSNYPFSLQEDNVKFIEELSDKKVTLTDVAEFQEFAKFLEVIREYADNPLDITYDKQVGDFTSGKSAMMFQGNWVHSMLEDFDFDFEYGMAPLPLMGTEDLVVDVSSSLVVNAEKDEAEIQAAVDFLEWMVTSDVGQEYITDKFNFLPALTNIEVTNLDPLSEVVYEATNAGKTIPWSHKIYPEGLIDNEWRTPIQEFYLYDEITGLELIEKLEEAWHYTVDKQN